MDIQIKDIIDKLFKVLKIYLLIEVIPMLDYNVFKHMQILVTFTQFGDYVGC